MNKNLLVLLILILLIIAPTIEAVKMSKVERADLKTDKPLNRGQLKKAERIGEELPPAPPF